MKPLNTKAYGSIPHLPCSRLGPGDHYISQGQARIATEKTRDKHDLVICQEKLDGSNVAVAKINGDIIALTRAGYTAISSPYRQHHEFDEWVRKNKKRFDAMLQDGERACGEWLLMAHGTRYMLPHEPFVLFDIIKQKRITCDELYRRNKFDFILPRILNRGGAFSVQLAIQSIATSGHGAIDPVEGAVWRVERNGVVDFLCKYVHHFKQDGKYFNDENPYWNEINR